nr:hypothetical protein [Verrucomicrobium spinosum]
MGRGGQGDVQRIRDDGEPLQLRQMGDHLDGCGAGVQDQGLPGVNAPCGGRGNAALHLNVQAHAVIQIWQGGDRTSHHHRERPPAIPHQFAFALQVIEVRPDGHLRDTEAFGQLRDAHRALLAHQRRDLSAALRRHQCGI